MVWEREAGLLVIVTADPTQHFASSQVGSSSPSKSSGATRKTREEDTGERVLPARIFKVVTELLLEARASKAAV